MLGTALALGCGDTSPAEPQKELDGGALTCPANYAECDGNPGTVCETSLGSDPLSCGACGKVCPGAADHQSPTCRSGQCAVVCEEGFVDCDQDPTNGCEADVGACGVTILAVVASPMGLATDESFVYYGSRGTAAADYLDGVIYKVPKNGGTPIVLASSLNRPLNLTIDETHVYWSNGGHDALPDGSIASIAKSGGPITTIVSGQVRPNNPVLQGDRLFWTTKKPAGSVYSARKDGTDVAPTEIAANLVNVSALEGAGDSLVWATDGTPGGDGSDALVERSNLDGSNRIQLAKGLVQPSFKLGVSADSVFVGNRADGVVRRLPLIGGPPVVVTTGAGRPHELVVDGDTLFITTSDFGTVIAVPTAGHGAPAGYLAATVAQRQTYASYLAVDAESVYWSEGSLTKGSGSIRKAKKP